MTLSVAIQMDPIHAIDIGGDSTFALALEAQTRGHTLFYYEPKNLSYRDGRVFARGHHLTVRAEKGNHFSFQPEANVELSDFDVVLLRQDPPYDMAYLTTTYVLQRIHPKTLVVNDPIHVRDAPEKLFPILWPDLIPPTLITNDRTAIRAFRAEHGDVIVKPLYGNGGAGVFRIRAEDENLGSLLETFEKLSREPLIVQKYLPEVRKGDKRIILVEGKAVGAINRVPAAGEARSNMHVGGRPEATELTAREQQICDAIGPELKKRGLIFVGIDVIGDYLTEINVTSPTGIHEIRRFGGPDIAGLVWDAIEARRTQT
ncbi:Glutathione synthetase [Alphaproteobacteria bacterium SO-S41]|nr:Glutathione synthetase [Alphaproteobacteria bacterium SO-S41]